MLAHRLRRWPNIVPRLGERLVFMSGAVKNRAITYTCFMFVVGLNH